MTKDDARCWLEIAGTWRTQPIVNPKKDEIERTGLYLWPFDERVAAALTAEERFAGSPMSFVRGGRGNVRLLSSDAGDRLRIGSATGPRDGKSYAELLEVTMDRLSMEPVGVTVKGERYEQLPNTRR